jgi:hypothetical protein
MIGRLERLLETQAHFVDVGVLFKDGLKFFALSFDFVCLPLQSLEPLPIKRQPAKVKRWGSLALGLKAIATISAEI